MALEAELTPAPSHLAIELLLPLGLVVLQVAAAGIRASSAQVGALGLRAGGWWQHMWT